MTRFVVDLGDIALPKEAEAEIAADMQKMVLGHMARLRIEKPFITKFPREWWGLIARLDFDSILEGELQIGRSFLQTRGGM
ncbi:hypothetical protein RNZ50_06075 [Paracoccaceae bacterium Fryx2]|nr:hypothetical protein [Paracoccaceae bacterium Fryx2]